MFCTNVHCSELEAKVEAVVEEITGDMLCNTNNNYVVHLQRIHKVEQSYVCMKTTCTQILSKHELSFMYHMLLYPTEL
jgi:hypothetical protein